MGNTRDYEVAMYPTTSNEINDTRTPDERRP